ncbi:DUF5777 family beta-barrel protein [Epilithonimonas hungarica]|uniref:DUF5777 domain-containing protein n=1 Tax=Epilithonimonas hungarica TaxID=454006 RepID=A0A1G7GMY4_9FLAO|nr:DUF5777 family beta-barrel protein [Epilithonimonas hungarica]MDP9956778.1 hypothetical protein [Epilithonimonas hungarica]MPT31244.1 hypothetical protein [Chryseobacterium sp.]SDE89484.1 hypothetical protein SAMN05421825_0519 [Epilithonimonas hungarica]
MSKLLSFISLFILILSYAQDDLLKEIDTVKAEEPYSPSFKALQVVTAQSTKLPSKKEFYLDISHRFGDVSDGFKNFFGLDNATTKLGVVYGLTDWMSLNFARHTYQKTYEFGAKYRLFKQEKESPFDIVGYNVLDINSELKKDDFPKLEFADRFAYLSQLLISRRFTENLTLQLTPSYIHRNLIEPTIDSKDLFSTGLGGRYKISKRVSINAEYFYNFENKNFYKNPLSVGMDIDTGGHVFQLVFSNSQANTETGYISNATGDWAKGHFFFGFNLYRVF